MFEERGFPETRVAHITRHAGVAYGSFYTYFPSKEAVFLEVADRLFEEMTRQDLVPSAGPSPPPASAAPTAPTTRRTGATRR